MTSSHLTGQDILDNYEPGTIAPGEIVGYFEGVVEAIYSDLTRPPEKYVRQLVWFMADIPTDQLTRKGGFLGMLQRRDRYDTRLCACTPCVCKKKYSAYIKQVVDEVHKYPEWMLICERLRRDGVPQ